MHSILLRAFAIACLLTQVSVSHAALVKLDSAAQFATYKTVVNFDGYVGGSQANNFYGTAANHLYESLGITFSNFGEAPITIMDWSVLNRVTTSPENVIGSIVTWGNPENSIFSNFIDVTFVNGVNEIGAYFGNDQWSGFATQSLFLYDIIGNELGLVLVGANGNTSVDQFIGAGSDSLIYRARFSNDAFNSLSVVLDDVMFSRTPSIVDFNVPEPGTYALVLVGLGVLGGVTLVVSRGVALGQSADSPK